jgi:N-ethylmaleimide reductase
MHHSLFTPLQLGAVTLQHRIVMPPLTRMRAGPSNVPTAMTAEYYGQRASEGGLIITEGTQVSASGQGYPDTPGIHTAAQIEGWRAVTSAVHARGGRIFLQLYHCGRISHSSIQPLVAPSAIAAAGDHLTASWTRVPFETPRALTLSEIDGVVEQFHIAARNALAAEFDGVEVHGANGYLIEQFLTSRSNRRTDRYGGSIENRARFLVEVVAAVIAAVGENRVGVRLSPFGTFNDVGDDEPLALYQYAVSALVPLTPTYLHLIEPRVHAATQDETIQAAIPSVTDLFRPQWPGVMIAAGGYAANTAAAVVAAGGADAIGFGRAFVANPDLVERIRQGLPLNLWHRPTFYGGDARGYTDYPRHDAVAAAVPA